MPSRKNPAERESEPNTAGQRGPKRSTAQPTSGKASASVTVDRKNAPPSAVRLNPIATPRSLAKMPAV